MPKTTYLDDLKRLAKGQKIAPTQISWRRAEHLQRRGWATIKLFHNRWQAIVTITDEGIEEAKKHA